jgi:hypothetical protein
MKEVNELNYPKVRICNEIQKVYKKCPFMVNNCDQMLPLEEFTSDEKGCKYKKLDSLENFPQNPEDKINLLNPSIIEYMNKVLQESVEKNLFYHLTKVYDKFEKLKSEVEELKNSINSEILNCGDKKNNKCQNIYIKEEKQTEFSINSSIINMSNSTYIESDSSRKSSFNLSELNLIDKKEDLQTEQTMLSLTATSNVCTLLYLENFKVKDILLSGQLNGNITAWDLNSNQPMYFFKEHTSFVNDMKCISSSCLDECIFASCSDDHTIKFWSIKNIKNQNNSSLKTIQNDSPIYSLAHISSEATKTKNNYLIYGDYANKIVIYNIDKALKISTIKNANKNYVSKIIIINSSYSYPTQIVTSGFTDINIYNFENKNKIRSYNEHKFGIQDIKHFKSPDLLIKSIDCHQKQNLDYSNLFISLSRDGVIKIWDVHLNSSIKTIQISQENISHCFYNLHDISNNKGCIDKIFLGTDKGLEIVSIENEGILDSEEDNQKNLQSRSLVVNDKVYMIVYLKNSNRIFTCNWESKEIKMLQL